MGMKSNNLHGIFIFLYFFSDLNTQAEYFQATQDKIILKT